jgi:hypothetical protein
VSRLRPGTCHEAPLYACKLGVRAALNDIRSNHPNDAVSLIMFSVPQSSDDDTGNGRRFNRVRTPLGQNYNRMLDTLWYPPSTIDSLGTEIRPFDRNKNLEVPRAMGGTCYSRGLMLAYNQFSSNVQLRSYNPSPAPGGDAGGLGRRGTQKLIIFETDGMPNYTASAGLHNGGANESYYLVRYNSSNPGASEYPSVASHGDNDTAVVNQITAICGQICALESASPSGYSTARKPVLIHTIAFGNFVEPGSPDRDAALATLAKMEEVGSVPADRRVNSPSAAYKIVTGTDDEMIVKLQEAFTQIVQDGVQVSLIE